MIIGIDPGLKGGICYGCEEGQWEVFPMPTTKTGLDLPELKKLLDCFVYLVVIEKVHSMPKQGVASTFKFGTGYGQIQGICAALAHPFILVTPQRWKKIVLTGYDWRKNKEASIDYVKRRFPHLNLKPTERCRKDSHGLADAVCLAEYGKMYQMVEETR